MPVDSLKTHPSKVGAYGFIYLITNKVNGKIYIGATTSSVYKRWSNHRIKSSLTKCKYLAAAIQKYGRDSFKIEIITKASSYEELNTLEQYYISLCNSNVKSTGYNLNSGGNLKGRPSISKVLKGEQALYKGWFFRYQEGGV